MKQMIVLLLALTTAQIYTEPTEKVIRVVAAHHHMTTAATTQSVIDKNKADATYTTISFFALATSLPLEALDNPYYLATSIQAAALVPTLYAAYRISARTFSFLFHQCFDDAYETDDSDIE